MEVRSVPGRGRCAFAQRDLRGGQVVLRESPLLVYAEAAAAATGSFCAHCCRCIASASPPLCQSCSRATFCDDRCHGAAAVSSHSPGICRALRELAALGMDHEAQTQGRFLIAALDLAARDPDGFQRLMLLDGQPGNVSEDPGAVAVARFVSGKRWSERKDLFSEEMLLALLAKDKINAFGLMAPPHHGHDDGQERRVRAYAIYPQAAMLNHDCLPKACRFEYLDKPGEGNTDMYIRLLHDVPQGSEICISYFPVNWSYGERQKRLVEDYGFECQCERCKVEQAWSDDDDNGGEDDDDAAATAADMEQDDGQDEQEEVAMDRDGDFPHAMFFVKYLCPQETCGGTMAPLPDDPTVMECNVCTRLRSEQEFLEDLQQHGMAQ